MAIRKFRKIMKPFTIVISIVFILSLVLGGYESFKSSRMSNKAQAAFKLNGKTVSRIDIERMKSAIASQYSGNTELLDKSNLEVLAFNQVLNQKLSLDLSKDLKIKVPSSEIEKEFKEVEDSIGDKDQFKRMLEYQGLTKDTFKKQIEENLLYNKTLEAFSNSINPTEEEIEEFYSMNINNRNISLEEAREKIVESIKLEEGFKKYNEALNSAKKEAKITELTAEYQEFVETEVYEEEGFKITNLDLANENLAVVLQGAGANKEEIEEIAKKNISRNIKIAKLAQEKGIEVSDKLSSTQKFNEYQRLLVKKYRTEVNPSENDLVKFFNNNKERYAVRATFDMNLAFTVVKPSKEDEKTTEAKAEEVLKSVTVENFKEVGENVSKEEGYLFEELGTFSKGMMVKEFEDAVSSAEANSVVNQIVKTGFGYHIIFVEEKDATNESWKASHILVRVTPSEKTKAEKMEKMEKIKEDISNGVVAFTEIQKLDEDIVQSRLLKGLTPEGLIPYLGFNPELIEKINSQELNTIGLEQIETGILMFQKIKEVNAEEANFEKSKDIVRNDYINNQAIEFLRKQGL